MPLTFGDLATESQSESGVSGDGAGVGLAFGASRSGELFEVLTGDVRGGKGEADADLEWLLNGGAKVGCRFSNRDAPDELDAGVGVSASRGARVGVPVVRDTDVDRAERGSLTVVSLEVPL